MNSLALCLLCFTFVGSSLIFSETTIYAGILVDKTQTVNPITVEPLSSELQVAETPDSANLTEYYSTSTNFLSHSPTTPLTSLVYITTNDNWTTWTSLSTGTKTNEVTITHPASLTKTNFELSTLTPSSSHHENTKTVFYSSFTSIDQSTIFFSQTSSSGITTTNKEITRISTVSSTRGTETKASTKIETLIRTLSKSKGMVHETEEGDIIENNCVRCFDHSYCHCSDISKASGNNSFADLMLLVFTLMVLR
jgi:hypothetical protein